jgi:hypothetical protein
MHVVQHARARPVFYATQSLFLAFCRFALEPCVRAGTLASFARQTTSWRNLNDVDAAPPDSDAIPY